MKGIVGDADIQGHFWLLVERLQGPVWGELWASLSLKIETFASLGLPRDVSDAVLWRLCQERELILLTNNRNAESADSLEATIRAENTPTCLPVFTLANAPRLLKSKDYAEQVTEKLLEALLRIDGLRGTGRLYLP
jgi:hypothetical protein